MNDFEHDVVIIGSGIAGLSSAIYTARENHNPLVIHGDEPGGQLTLTTDVENYPGFPDGIGGPELVEQMKEQAKQFGAEFKHGIVQSVNKNSNGVFKTTLEDETIETPTVIVASGASAKTLGIEGEDELMGFGVSTCATCDGAFFQGEDMVVIGGGDAACEEASFLTRFADTVYLVHRRDELRAESYWQEEVQKHVENGEIEILWNTEATKIAGSQSEGVKEVQLVEHPEGHPKQKPENKRNSFSLDVGAVFLAIGHTPNTSFLEDTDVELTENGYIDIDGGTEELSTMTNVEGLFAAGDVYDSHYQQAATASGSGVKAALDVDSFL